jgi:hydroxymethylglutaryl-CoA lyase
MGFREIEITSMVPKTVLSQFTDSIEIIKYSNSFSKNLGCVLVPNFKGAQLAIKANIKQLNFVLSASEEHNLANVKMTTRQSLKVLEDIITLKNSNTLTSDIKIIGSISTSFGCSISGKISESKVLNLVDKMLQIGIDEVSIADTVGYAHPKQVSSLIKKVYQISEAKPIISHFHDTRGFGLANVVAALDEGVVKFDASIRGLGGCPYAPGASGNIATEDCVNLLESMGYETSINKEKLRALCLSIAKWLPDEHLHGKFLSSAS